MLGGGGGEREKKKRKCGERNKPSGTFKLTRAVDREQNCGLVSNLLLINIY